jgi:hypothetical protein
MSRVVRTESATRTRERLLQAIALALRGLVGPELEEAQLRDRLAFTALALDEIASSVNETCTAWEKRGYWVKADRFRAEWIWVDRPRRDLRADLQRGDMPGAVGHAGELLIRLAAVHIPARLQKSTPWDGAWRQWVDRADGG